MMLIVLDSLRYDAWLAAGSKNLSRIGDVEKRYSYATWTAPSHFNMLMMQMPHTRPVGMTISEYYHLEVLKFLDRLDIDGFPEEIMRAAYFPTHLRSIGYHTRAIVTMPVLSTYGVINRDFESYDMIGREEVDGIVDRLQFDAARPTFYLINIGLTHYPYTLPDEDPYQYPDLMGLNGALKVLFQDGPRDIDLPRLLTKAEIAAGKERQIRSVSYLDGFFGRLFEKVPKDTYLIVTADHGELFGEDGFFGHGPCFHEKVLEVPFVEGIVPK